MGGGQYKVQAKGPENFLSYICFSGGRRLCAMP